jgi:hypothetical protein
MGYKDIEDNTDETELGKKHLRLPIHFEKPQIIKPYKK